MDLMKTSNTDILYYEYNIVLPIIQQLYTSSCMTAISISDLNQITIFVILYLYS